MRTLTADLLARLEESVENPRYFVFAKGMQWARDKLQSAHPVSFPSEKDPDAGAIPNLYLMTPCQYANHFQQHPA